MTDDQQLSERELRRRGVLYLKFPQLRRAVTDLLALLDAARAERDEAEGERDRLRGELTAITTKHLAGALRDLPEVKAAFDERDAARRQNDELAGKLAEARGELERRVVSEHTETHRAYQQARRAEAAEEAEKGLAKQLAETRAEVERLQSGIDTSQEWQHMANEYQEQRDQARRDAVELWDMFTAIDAPLVDGDTMGPRIAKYGSDLEDLAERYQEERNDARRQNDELAAQLAEARAEAERVRLPVCLQCAKPVGSGCRTDSLAELADWECHCDDPSLGAKTVTELVAELKRFTRMYEGDQKRVDDGRKMMLGALGFDEGPGYEALLVTLCSAHKRLRGAEEK